MGTSVPALAGAMSREGGRVAVPDSIVVMARCAPAGGARDCTGVEAGPSLSGAAAEAACEERGSGAPPPRHARTPLAVQVARARLTMDEIVLFVWDVKGLASMQAVCAAWRDGVRGTSLATSNHWPGDQCLKSSAQAAGFVTSFPRASALRVYESTEPWASVARPVSCMASLQRLTLWSGWVDELDQGMAVLSSDGSSARTTLTRLSLQRTGRLSGVGMASIARLSLLTELALCSCSLWDAEFAPLGSLRALRYLWVSPLADLSASVSRQCYRQQDGCRGEAEGTGHVSCRCRGPMEVAVETIAGLTSLTTLQLRDCRALPTDVLAKLGSLPQLWALRVSDCGPPRAAAAGAEAGLAHLTSVTSLDLEWPSAGADAMLHHVRGLTRLRRLMLRAPVITDAGVACMHDGLAALESLSLFVPIRLRGERSLAITHTGLLAGLADKTGLTSLSLGRSGVSDAGEKLLRRALGPRVSVRVSREC